MLELPTCVYTSGILIQSYAYNIPRLPRYAETSCKTITKELILVDLSKQQQAEQRIQQQNTAHMHWRWFI